MQTGMTSFRTRTCCRRSASSPACRPVDPLTPTVSTAVAQPARPPARVCASAHRPAGWWGEPSRGADVAGVSPVPLSGFGRNGCGFAQEYGIFVEEFRRLPSAPYPYWRCRYLSFGISVISAPYLIGIIRITLVTEWHDSPRGVLALCPLSCDRPRHFGLHCGSATNSPGLPRCASIGTDQRCSLREGY